MDRPLVLFLGILAGVSLYWASPRPRRERVLPHRRLLTVGGLALFTAQITLDAREEGPVSAILFGTTTLLVALSLCAFVVPLVARRHS